ncbi:hypothetical protein BDY24DRAFT_440272 [Mrakia frigida]|uniref:uncharacterized protein n=1 Tax=Mrakia frigida TaxID=29902 RepID=UPI003FCBFB77
MSSDPSASTSTTDRPTDLSPPEDEIVSILVELKKTQPDLGVKKLQALILEKNPHWRLSEKRLQSIRVKHALQLPSSNTAPTNTTASSNTSLPALKLAPLDIKKGSKEDISARMQDVPDACHEQIRMHIEILQTGEQRGMGWYALLPDGEEDYELEHMLWLDFGPDKPSIRMLEKAKLEAVMGNPIGVFILFSYLNITRTNDPALTRKVSATRLARQLRTEYGPDPWKMKLQIDGGDRALLKLVNEQHLVFAGPSMSKDKFSKFSEIE